MIEVPEEEFATLGCNVLAVRPGVVILADGNPATAAALAAAGCEVHAYPATEIGINGSGGPTVHDPADPAWLSACGTRTCPPPPGEPRTPSTRRERRST